MKKKFIAVSVLICALALGSTTLTSCVDDNESASVTAIREAKAAQLNALAAEANANAKVNEALAALKQAKADAIKVQTEFEQQEYAARLEKLQAEYAQAIAEAQKQQAEAEQQMAKDLQEYQKTLYSNYKQAQNEVTTLSNDIAEKNIEISKLEAGLISAKATAKQQIVGFRIDSIKYEAQKKAYQDMGDNNYEELVKQLENVNIQYSNQTKLVETKNNEAQSAEKVFEKAQWAFNGGYENGVEIEPTLETGKVIKDLKEAGLNYLLNENDLFVDPEDETTPSITVYNIKETEVIRKNASLNQELINAQKALGTKDDKAANYMYDLDGDGFYEPVIWTDTNKDENMTVDELTSATKWGQYLYWENQYKDAKKAWEDAKDEEKDQYKVWMDQAEAKMLEEKSLLITENEENIAEIKEEIEALKKTTDAFAGDTYKEYTDAINAVLSKEGKALQDARDAVDEAKLAQADLEGQKNALYKLVGENGTTINIEQEIANCEALIADATKNIKEAELLLTAPDTNETAQTVIDNAKAELEELNNKLELAQIAADSWYKQLEASLKGETPSVPETPAE